MSISDIRWGSVAHSRAGLISQVAEELWEVKDRKIKNLTKEDITIVEYKKMLVKNSRSRTFPCVRRADDEVRYRCAGEGEAVQQEHWPQQNLDCDVRSAVRSRRSERGSIFSTVANFLTRRIAVLIFLHVSIVLPRHSYIFSRSNVSLSRCILSNLRRNRREFDFFEGGTAVRGARGRL